MNMTLCSMTLKDMRPALRRTMLLGMRMRAVAMVRAIWKTSGCYYTTLRCLTIWKTSGGVKSPRGVPSTGTSALIGTW